MENNISQTAQRAAYLRFFSNSIDKVLGSLSELESSVGCWQQAIQPEAIQ
jgi:hypothetical protein